MKIRKAYQLIATFGAMLGAAQLSYASAMNILDELVLVPFATFTNTGSTTAVGLMPKSAGTIFWAFFDADGIRRANGSFVATANSLNPFVWSNQATAIGATNLVDVNGYLLFALDTNGNGLIEDADDDALTANAFLVIPSANDVAFIPTSPVHAISLSSPNPSNWFNDPIETLPIFFGAFGTVNIQYLIDGQPGGNDTTIYIWSTQNPGSTQSMTVFDGEGVSAPVTLQTQNDNLNIINPEGIAGLSTPFLDDGFFEWNTPFVGGVFVFSIVSSDAFGATQTLMANFDF